MAMTSMSVVFSVFVLTVHHRGSRGVRPPKWLRVLTIDIMAPRLFCSCLSKPNTHISTNRWDPRQRHSSIKFYDSEVNMIANTVRTSISIKSSAAAADFTRRSKIDNDSSITERNVDNWETIKGAQHQLDNDKKRIEKSKNFTAIDNRALKTQRSVAEEIQLQLEKLMDRYKLDELEQTIIKEWQNVAIVFDRCLFYLFTAVIAFATLFLLIIMPLTKKETALSRLH